MRGSTHEGRGPHLGFRLAAVFASTLGMLTLGIAVPASADTTIGHFGHVLKRERATGEQFRRRGSIRGPVSASGARSRVRQARPETGLGPGACPSAPAPPAGHVTQQ